MNGGYINRGNINATINLLAIYRFQPNPQPSFSPTRPPPLPPPPLPSLPISLWNNNKYFPTKHHNLLPITILTIHWFIFDIRLYIIDWLSTQIKSKLSPFWCSMCTTYFPPLQIFEWFVCVFSINLSLVKIRYW